jgi:FixJ family two-component response regulator
MRRTVAVIDDDTSVLDGFQRLLNASGLDAEIYTSAEEYLARRADSTALCLILDIHLDGISGVELRRRLSAVGSAVPVIFVTGRDDAETRREATLAGCVSYLCKPVPSRALLEAIEAALARPRSSG